MAGAGTILRRLGDAFASSLRLRVLGLTLVAFALVAIPAFLAFLWIVDATTVRLSTLFAERQILYDRQRGTGPLSREVALAETLARSPSIMQWAADEESPAKRGRALAELEQFRRSFQDQSYFFAIKGSGNYYFNDRQGSFDRAQLRYTLSPENDKDAWFYKTLALGPGCRLNVNNDRALKVTKVWINCVVEHKGEALGVLGTGIDLSAFIGRVVNSDQVGVESLFVDASGAIQASRDESLIDFHSLTKDIASRNTVFQMLDGDEDRATLRAMMSEIRSGREEVAASFLSVGGREMLVGVGYLGQLGWYNVTIMDVPAIVGTGLFAPIGALLALVIVIAAALVTLLFKRSVLDRLARAETSLRRVESGDYSLPMPDAGRDEIGRLALALNRMARSVRDNTEELERAVRERTDQLERIAFLDSMTGVANRRGFADAFVHAHARSADGGLPVGLLLMDVDLFKAINDTRGHRAGDEVIVEVARRIGGAMEAHEICARWGGDEFVVLARDCTPQALAATGRRLLDALRGKAVALSDGTAVRITMSIGALMTEPEDTLTTAAAKADIALYEAKRAGRNRVTIYDPSVHARHDGTMKVA